MFYKEIIEGFNYLKQLYEGAKLKGILGEDLANLDTDAVILYYDQYFSGFVLMTKLPDPSLFKRVFSNLKDSLGVMKDNVGVVVRDNYPFDKCIESFFNYIELNQVPTMRGAFENEEDFLQRVRKHGMYIRNYRGQRVFVLGDFEATLFNIKDDEGMEYPTRVILLKGKDLKRTVRFTEVLVTRKISHYMVENYPYMSFVEECGVWV